MRITTCTAADLSVLERHLPTGKNNAHAYHFSRQKKGEAEYLIAWIDDIPVGYALINWNGFRDDEPRAAYPGCPAISNLGVDEAWRGKGIGSALIASAEERIAARDFRQSGLGVGVENPDAARLYARLGYRDTSLRCESRYSWYDNDDVCHEVVETDMYLVKDLPA